MRLDADQLERLAVLIAAELRKQRPRRRPLPCGRGSSAPICWGSTIYGPRGCTCIGDGDDA